MKNDHTRKFNGKIDGFADKQERAFEKKHLKAYLNGWSHFQYGWEHIDGIRKPLMHRVK